MKRGFTLIEIMIAVAVLIVLLSMALPNLLRSRVTAMEVIALANTKTIANACQFYRGNQGTYPDGLSDLSAGNVPYIDSQLGSGSKQGYEFIYNRTGVNSFTLNANPTSGELLSGKHFYADESGVIRGRADGPAGPGDEIIQ